MSDAKKEFWICYDGINGSIETPHGVLLKRPSGISGGGSMVDVHVVHASWRDQAEKLAEALRKSLCFRQIGVVGINRSGLSCRKDAENKCRRCAALAEFEKWKRGEK